MGGAMSPFLVCRHCGTNLDLSRRNAVSPLVYRNVTCPGCGRICVLEGPERNVAELPGA
jgi:hypothetical protein